MKYLILFILFFELSYSQSDFDKVIKASEILVNGLSILKKDRTEVKETNSKVIESICIKNKLSDKITYLMIGKNEEDAIIKKELVIQKDGKECMSSN